MLDRSGDGALRKTEFSGRVAGNRERSLRRGINRGRVAAGKIDDHAMRFQTAVMKAGRAVFCFNNRVAIRKRGFDFRQITAFVFLGQVFFAAGPGCRENPGSTGLDCSVGRDDVQ